MESKFENTFYTIAEVADVCKLSVRTILRKIKSHDLPPLHPATRRFRGDELRAMYESGKRWSQISLNPVKQSKVLRRQRCLQRVVNTDTHRAVK